MKVRLTFTEPALGTLAGNKELATDYIASKHPQQIQKDEMEAIDNIEEDLQKGSTVFPRENGKPFIWDYQLKGFFKEACEAMQGMEVVKAEELKTARLTKYLYKKTIDKLIFIAPRKIFPKLPKKGELTFHERPLRGQTMRGERITLVRSEILPAGTSLEFEVICLNKKHEGFVRQWLNYGTLYGLLQWRSGGWGRFEWKEIKA